MLFDWWWKNITWQTTSLIGGEKTSHDIVQHRYNHHALGHSELRNYSIHKFVRNNGHFYKNISSFNVLKYAVFNLLRIHPVWPDVWKKVAKKSKSGQSSCNLGYVMFSNKPKKSPNIYATFVRNFVPKSFRKTGQSGHYIGEFHSFFPVWIAT